MSQKQIKDKSQIKYSDAYDYIDEKDIETEIQREDEIEHSIKLIDYRIDGICNESFNNEKQKYDREICVKLKIRLNGSTKIYEANILLSEYNEFVRQIKDESSYNIIYCDGGYNVKGISDGNCYSVLLRELDVNTLPKEEPLMKTVINNSTKKALITGFENISPTTDIITVRLVNNPENEYNFKLCSDKIKELKTNIDSDSLVGHTVNITMSNLPYYDSLITNEDDIHIVKKPSYHTKLLYHNKGIIKAFVLYVITLIVVYGLIGLLIYNPLFSSLILIFLIVVIFLLSGLGFLCFISIVGND